MLNSITAINGKARKGLVGVLNDQLTGYLKLLGLGSPGGPSAAGPAGAPTGRGKQTKGDLGESGDTRSKGTLGPFGASADLGDTGEMDYPFPAHGSKSNEPDLPFKPDWTLYGMHEGKLDDNDDPEGGGDGQGTGGNNTGGNNTGGGSSGGLTPPPLVQADTSPGGIATAGKSGDPLAPSKPGGTGILDDPRVRFVKDHFTIETGPSKEIYPWPGHPNKEPDKKYVDPDQTGAAGGAVLRPEQIDMKLNGRKRPVNPNGGVGGDEPIDGSTPPPGAGGIDPTMALYDPDAPVFVVSGDAPPRMTTAPIDYMPGYGSDGAGPSTGDGGGMRGNTNTSGDWF
jgi:hypothetical protein